MRAIYVLVCFGAGALALTAPAAAIFLLAVAIPLAQRAARRWGR